MKFIKKIWWIILLVLLVIGYFLDSAHKNMLEYRYKSQIKIERDQEIKFDSIVVKAQVNIEKIDLIKQAYECKRDSLNRLKAISGLNRTRMLELDNQLKVLDNANELVKEERIRVKKKYEHLVDSMSIVISQKQEKIDKLKDDINALNYKIKSIEMRVKEEREKVKDNVEEKKEKLSDALKGDEPELDSLPVQNDVKKKRFKLF